MSRFVSRQEAIEKGLPRYFTGSPCKRGHESERWTLSGGCLACIEENKRREREAFEAAKGAANAG